MRAFIPVVSTAALRKRYNDLLTSDWKRSTVEKVLNLLWAEIAESERPLNVAFQAALDPHRDGIGEHGYHQLVLEEIAHFRHHFKSEGIIPEMPPNFPSVKRGKLTAQAETTWTYLILQNLAQLNGDTGFFADTQSHLFLVAIDFLLPELRQRGYEREHLCLVNALYMHTFITWTLDPQRQAHHFFLQAVLMDYLGRPGLRQENLLQACRLTPLEDNSFLTKFQAYVFSLLDTGKFRAAKDYLLDLYRRVPQAYLQELGEMLDDVHNKAPVSRR